MSTTREEEDRLAILNPDDWPNWPMLPLKRFGHNRPDTAVLLDARLSGGTHEKPLFLEANMWDLEKVKAKIKDAVPRTIDEVLADGWIVD